MIEKEAVVAPTPPIQPSMEDGSSIPRRYEFDLPEPAETTYGVPTWPLIEPGGTAVAYYAVIDDELLQPRVRLTIAMRDAHVSHYLMLGVGEALGRMLIAADLEARRQAESSGGAS